MSGDEDPAPKASGKQKRPGNMWVNILRVDCTNISNKDATRWLAEYANVVEIAFHKLRSGLHRVVGIDADDLLAVGRMAILEAVTTHDEAHGSSLRTWVGILVYWRMSGLLRKATRQDGEIVSHLYAVREQEASELDEFETRMDCIEDLQLLAGEFIKLPLRTRTILLGRLAGAESREIASSLGISAFREQQIVAEGRAALRAVFVTDHTETMAEPPASGTSEVIPWTNPTSSMPRSQASSPAPSLGSP